MQREFTWMDRIRDEELHTPRYGVVFSYQYSVVCKRKRKEVK